MRSDKRGYYSEEDFEKEFGGRLSGEDGSGSDHQKFSIGRRGKKKEKKGRKRREKVGGKKNSRKKTVIIILASLIILIVAGAMLIKWFLKGLICVIPI